MSEHQLETASFRYNEQILVESSDDVTSVRVEASSQWNPNTKVHPFGHLNKLFEVADKVIGITDASENDGDQPFLEMKMLVSSSASQQLPSSNKRLNLVPTMDGSLPTSPSGFFVQIRSSLSPSSLLMNQIDTLVKSWMEQRLITTPLHKTSWDIIVESGGEDDDKTATTLVQAFLPTNGAAWSADALQQSFRASLGCEGQPQFMGISATGWSNRLVTGTAWNKQFWWRLSSSRDAGRQVNVGMQLEQYHKDAKSLLSLMENSKTSCLLGKRSIQHVHPASSSTSSLQSYELSASKTSKTALSESSMSMDPILSVDMVLRRTYPQKGRLETWITGNESSNCSLRFRQVIPAYLTPSWQTLEIFSSEEETPKIQPQVEWKEDGASIVTFSSTSIPESIVMSLDYGPRFVPYDDIPGDPNRGRELPPAVVQVQCPTERFDLYSNSPLILPPVPDMSMPFNVLSLSCSLYAYLIGTIMSLLVKRASEKVTYKLHPKKKPKSKFQKLKEKIKSKLNKLKCGELKNPAASADGQGDADKQEEEESLTGKDEPRKQEEAQKVNE